ncbi:DUF2325 domain-containing protein [Lacticaseibacillus jixianensis]|uniref:DUF2325 domain-containing protein n=1 Tax=Lacticaseibacillus jixianensis TaxID=2486012 RepID=A0ABW4BB41_9LACO|nr:DUF2325 domain-containing protein [Lacticaseibacillus jixianensis]
MSDKEHIIALLKTQITEQVARLDPGNVAEVGSIITKLVKIAQDIDCIKFIEPSAPSKPIAPTSTETAATAPVAEKAAPTTEAKAEQAAGTTPPKEEPQPQGPGFATGWNAKKTEYVGRFRKSITGGTLDGVVRVSETVLHVMDPHPHNGDWVMATLTEPGVGTHPARYRFDIVEPDPTPAAIKSVRFLLVKYVPDIRRYQISFKDPDFELPVETLIRQEDVDRLHIKPGAYIDFNYPKGKPEEGRATWVYTEDDAAIKRAELFFEKRNAQKTAKTPQRAAAPAATTTAPAQPTAKTAAKTPAKKPAKKPARTPKPRFKHTFDGKTVLLVAGTDSPCEAKFRTIVTARGGKFKTVSNRDSQRTLQTRVRNADFIVVYTGDVSHQHMWDGKDYAKKYSIPMYFAKTTTEKNMMQAYTRALANQEKAAAAD